MQKLNRNEKEFQVLEIKLLKLCSNTVFLCFWSTEIHTFTQSNIHMTYFIS